jgi:hypothetical protein
LNPRSQLLQEIGQIPFPRYSGIANIAELFILIIGFNIIKIKKGQNCHLRKQDFDAIDRAGISEV